MTTTKPTPTSRLIDGDFTNTHELKLYRDPEWQEYVARVFCKANGKLVAEYMTDDKGDAKTTGRTILARATACNATSNVW